MAQPSLLEALGGEVVLGMIVDRFMDRVFSDSMIGFFFAGKDQIRIKAKEYELAAASLGAGAAYTGRPLGAAHAAHPIASAHFFRRIEILRQTLEDFQVPGEVASAWLAHNQSLHDVVVGGVEPACGQPPAQGAPTGSGEA